MGVKADEQLEGSPWRARPPIPPSRHHRALVASTRLISSSEAFRHSGIAHLRNEYGSVGSSGRIWKPRDAAEGKNGAISDFRVRRACSYYGLPTGNSSLVYGNEPDRKYRTALRAENNVTIEESRPTNVSFAEIRPGDGSGRCFSPWISNFVSVSRSKRNEVIRGRSDRSSASRESEHGFVIFSRGCRCRVPREPAYRENAPVGPAATNSVTRTCMVLRLLPSRANPLSSTRQHVFYFFRPSRDDLSRFNFVGITFFARSPPENANHAERWKNTRRIEPGSLGRSRSTGRGNDSRLERKSIVTIARYFSDR